jgi:hypothetical protein
VYTQFEDLNLYVYHSARGLLLDVLIWCLAPYVDDSREYGAPRIYLAQATRYLVRRCYRISD